MVNPSPWAMARSALTLLAERWRRLVVPFLLLAAISLVQDSLDWLRPDADLLEWFVFGLPFSILLVPVEVALLHVLMAGEGDARRLPPAFLKKSLLYGLYSAAVFALVGVFAVILILAGMAVLDLILDTPVSALDPGTRVTATAVACLPAVWLGLRLILVPAAVVDGRRSPLELSFRLTRGRGLAMLLSGLLLLVVPYAPVAGLEWAVAQWFASPGPLAWAMAFSLLTSLFVPPLFALTAVWYALAAREDAASSPAEGD